jgi:hypothetical protein
MTAPQTEMRRIRQSLGTVLRMERLILRHYLQTRARHGAFLAVAGILALIGLAMLNIAGFFWLAETLSAGLSAFVVAVFDLTLAGGLVLSVARSNPDRQIEPAIRIRDMALGELQEDADRIADEAGELARDLRRVARDPLGSLLPSVIGPLLSLLLSLRKK